MLNANSLTNEKFYGDLPDVTTSVADCKDYFQALLEENLERLKDLIPSQQVSGWQKEMQSVPVGWDGYKAPSPNDFSIQFATRLEQLSPELDLEFSNIDPSAIGGLGMYTKFGEREALVEVLNDQNVRAILSDGTEHHVLICEVGKPYAFLSKIADYLYEPVEKFLQTESLCS